MADSRFFENTGPYALQALAEQCGAQLSGGANGAKMVQDVAPLQQATALDIAFFENNKYRDALKTSKAGACILHPDNAADAPDGMALLLSEQPYSAYAQIAAYFYPTALQPDIATEMGIHPSATIDATAHIHPSAVIGAHAKIGAGTKIGAHVVIGRGVVIGEQCSIQAGCVITHSIIGNGCIVHSGVHLGQDGFGFAQGSAGILKVPQLGRVTIGNQVEIGAGTCIDRGTGPDTVIGNHVKIDNLVQLGHNVQVGDYTIIVSQVGIAGSTKIGKAVQIGGQVGIAGHLSIGDGAQIAAQSGVMQDVPAGSIVGGAPAIPVRQWHRQTVALARLGKGNPSTRTRNTKNTG